MEIIGKSSKIKEAIQLARKLMKTDITVLLTGESGTGKEVFATYIHQNGKRASKPFIAVNCGAISQSILESELFGHEKGSFTGAVATRKGYFETANDGTIFLDEAGEMSLDTQVKLLRVLEAGEFYRVGSSETLRTNARIIVATNRSLEHAVSSKKFRHDLYFRLRVATINLPPLRERKEDILLLAEKFVYEFEKKYQVKFKGFSNDATRVLLDYGYPGNIRELRNLIETSVALENHDIITKEKIKRYLANISPIAPAIFESKKDSHINNDQHQEADIYQQLAYLQKEMAEIKKMLSYMQRLPKVLPEPSANEGIPANHDYKEADERDDRLFSLFELEKQAIYQALKETNGNKRQAAKKLGIAERTLYRKIKRYRNEV